MKFTCISILIWLMNFGSIFGQSYFEVEGQDIKTERLITSYHFSVDEKDSFRLKLLDSTIVFCNKSRFIKKTLVNNLVGSSLQARIEYYNSIGKDSLTKNYLNGQLNLTTRTRYDSLGRILEIRYTNHVYQAILRKTSTIIPPTGDIVMYNVPITRSDSDYFNGKRLERFSEVIYDSLGRKVLNEINNDWKEYSVDRFEYSDTVREGKSITLQSVIQQELYVYRRSYVDGGIDYSDGIVSSDGREMPEALNEKLFGPNAKCAKVELLEKKDKTLSEIQSTVRMICDNDSAIFSKGDCIETKCLYILPDKSATMMFVGNAILSDREDNRTVFYSFIQDF